MHVLTEHLAVLLKNNELVCKILLVSEKICMLNLNCRYGDIHVPGK